MDIKMIVIIFLYIIAISISACPIFRVKRGVNSYRTSTLHRVKIKNRKVSNDFLLLKIKKIIGYIMFFHDYKFKTTSKREL